MVKPKKNKKKLKLFLTYNHLTIRLSCEFMKLKIKIQYLKFTILSLKFL